jgi:hypothetical protein
MKEAKKRKDMGSDHELYDMLDTAFTVYLKRTATEVTEISGYSESMAELKKRLSRLLDAGFSDIEIMDMLPSEKYFIDRVMISDALSEIVDEQ